MHEDAATVPDPRYGIEVYVNDTLVFPELIVTPADLNTVFTTDEFSAADVGLIAGAGADNIVALKGISYSDDGGGSWMGLDYHHLETMPVPEPGSLGMMLAGLFWTLPILVCERGKRK